jgi:hypothetical protein
MIEESFEDAIADQVEDSSDEATNDTNEASLNYFSRVTNHYQRLIKSSPVVPPRHTVKFPIIADSGANFHMFRDIEFFESLSPVTGNVILGDGKTSVPIQGIGVIKLCIDGHTILIPNVCFVPSLAENIYSLFCHIQCKDHGLHSSFSEGLYIVFPDFQTKAILGENDIYVDAIPSTSVQGLSALPPKQLSTMSICRNMSHFENEVQKESVKVDNLLAILRRYYPDIKTKRQLNMEIPAGFRQDNDYQHLVRDAHLYHLSQATPDLAVDTSLQDDVLMDDCHQTQNLSGDELATTSAEPSDHDSNTRVPILMCIDKVSSSLPSRLTLNEDHIRACIGFRRIDIIKRHLSMLYQDTVQLDSTPRDAVLDRGDLATLRETPRNTTPVPRPVSFGDVVHMDIVFGPEVALANVHYGLLFTDRFSRMTYLYPLQNLTSDIPKQLDAFFAHLGFLPKRLISDFDLKLIGGKSRDHLNQLQIHVNAAPALHQDRNGLAERHWQTLTAMARNWLASAELPGKFWFLAVKRAAEICNYFPIQVENNTWTTPLELAHGVKPDLRTLFKVFGLAAVRRERAGDSRLGKFESQSTPMIAVGKCPNSPGLQFYNPANGTFVSSIDYKFQNHTTSGTYFGMHYQPGVFIDRLDESTSIFAPKYNLESLVYVHTHSPPSLGKIIGIPTYQTPDVYTVVFKDGSISEYTEDLLSAAPNPVCSN